MVVQDGVCRVSRTEYLPAPPAVQPETAAVMKRPRNCATLYSDLHDLSGRGYMSDEDSTTMYMDLSVDDQNAIKLTDMVAKDRESTWLTFTPNTISDMVGSAVVPRNFTDGINAINFTEDATSPRLVQSALNLTAETLMLSFSEPVRVSSLVVTEITLMNDNCLICDAGSYRHEGECVESCPDGFYAFGSTNTEASQCKKCDSTCSTCSGPGNDECTACQATLLLNAGVCSFPCFEDGKYRNDGESRYVTAEATVEFDYVLLNGFNAERWELLHSIVSALVSLELNNER
jgi:hypothetical protein